MVMQWHDIGSGLVAYADWGEDLAWQAFCKARKEPPKKSTGATALPSKAAQEKPQKRTCQSENQKHPVNLQYNHHQYNNHRTSSENFLPFIEEDTIWLWTIGMDFRFYRDYHIPSPIRQSGGKSIPYGLQVENQYFIGDIKQLI